LLVLIGLKTGILSGFFGVCGGFILVPLFIIVLSMKPRHAIGNSLLTIFISALFASYLYAKSGKVIF